MRTLALWLAPSIALGADFLQVDAGAPGLAVQVNILREEGGFTGDETVSTSCEDIVVGPVFALDRAADPDEPISGSVLQTVFFIDAEAVEAECAVSVDGLELEALSAGVDNLFTIISPAEGPVDGGTNDADGSANGTIVLSSSLRSDGGTLVLDSLEVPDGVTLAFDSTDPVSATEGNEAYLPVILLVVGDVSIDGVLSVEGQDGDDATSGVASDGGSGGPGGGGGGVGSNCGGPAAYAPGDGFTGGGGTATGTCIDFTYGGTGAIEGPDGEAGGEGLFTDVENGALGYAGGTGGGTGSPWGTGGGGGYCCGTAGAGGYGGGGGNGHSDTSGWGGGGGGFGTDGENGTGSVGGSSSSYLVGGAGLTNGHTSLVPLAGGSGGAGGDSGSGGADGAGGGGGGGALLIAAEGLTFGADALIQAWGGDGGDTVGTNPGSSTGGAGGSGGGVLLAARGLSGLSASSLSLNGGAGGHEYYGYYSGDGGEGRLRVDGTEPPELDEGPTGASATTFEGPVITLVSDTVVTVSSDSAVVLVVLDEDGEVQATIDLDEDASEDLLDVLSPGDNLLVVSDAETGVIGPKSAAVLTFAPDSDGDGAWAESYGGDDCDDGDDAISPSADELCDGLDNNCDGAVDESEAVDATNWYSDLDGDGYGDPSSGVYACDPPEDTVADASDCDDGDSAVSPDGSEVCDGEDNDCDDLVDDEDDSLDASTTSTWYTDGDGDGYGAAEDDACEPGEDQTATSGDCDDEDPSVYPGAPETPDDGVDQDCDGADATSPGETGETGGTGETGETGSPDTDTAPAETANDTGGADTDAEGVYEEDYKGGAGCTCGSAATPGTTLGWAWLALGAALVRRGRRNSTRRV